MRYFEGERGEVSATRRVLSAAELVAKGGREEKEEEKDEMRKDQFQTHRRWDHNRD